ncbi:MAG: STAS domain-containing protein [Planctomycetota bacterium]|nr:STAS domain-containing protein [Planctomycetota bacterium]
MSELKLTGRTVRASSSLEVLVEDITGAIDASTARSFETALKQVVDAGHKNVVFVFTKVLDINSTGMGALIQCADRIRAAGGEICLVGVSQNVLSLFEMLGILPILPVYPTEEKAIEYLSQRATAPAPAVAGEQAAPPAPSPEATPTVPSSVPAPSAPEETAPPESGQSGKDSSGAAAAAGETEEESGDGLYPLELDCPDCEKPLEIARKGYFRCPGCGCYFVAEPDGNVQSIRLDDSTVLELRLPGDPSMGQGIRHMAGALAAEMDYPVNLTREIDKCLEVAWNWATQYADGASKPFSLFLAANPEEWVAGITIPGGGPSAPAGIEELKKLAHQVDLAPISTGGAVLKILFRAEEAEEKS